MWMTSHIPYLHLVMLSITSNQRGWADRHHHNNAYDFNEVCDVVFDVGPPGQHHHDDFFHYCKNDHQVTDVAGCRWLSVG